MSVSSISTAPASRNANVPFTRGRDSAPRPLALLVAALMLCLGMLAPVAAFVLTSPTQHGAGMSVSCFDGGSACRINGFSPNTSSYLR
jgi:hypothetical protein